MQSNQIRSDQIRSRLHMLQSIADRARGVGYVCGPSKMVLSNVGDRRV
jgi:hypothetical protein